ncbi:MAG: AAA family ATPase, partial [Acholeplasmatales bacterium]|nr:AAA family ATPase [Acholeplasmatales bacterium]
LFNNSIVSSIRFDNDIINNNLKNLVTNNKIVIIENRIYPRHLYDAEFNVCNRINDLLNTKVSSFDESKIDSFISRFEEDNFNLTREQKSAVKLSLKEKISIITGGPGTGKTTILRCILQVLAALKDEDLHNDSFTRSLLLLAPTGKAAKRMSAQTTIAASTIHKALGYDETGHFAKGKSDRLDASFVIIDESSMIDIDLMSHLLDALNNSTRLIFVGDVNQLPSVGPGNVLSDLITSQKIKVSYLSEIMRQASDSNIIKLAQMINNKNIDFNIFNDKKEVFFYNVNEAQIMPLILKILARFKETGADFYNDMQILAPMYSGLSGIDELNKAIQNTFNSNNDIIKSGEQVYKVFDKVLQTANDPKLEIMNGDTGVIKAINKTDDETNLYIDFDSRLVKYSSRNLSDLTLGYAISIHKSQGSEYKNVIIPISRASRIMLKKKLLYTAVTRAKEKVILIGDINTLTDSLYKEDDVRLTSLARMLNPSLLASVDNKKEKEIIRIDDPVSAFSFIGETNMDSLTPYDFLDKE